MYKEHLQHNNKRQMTQIKHGPRIQMDISLKITNGQSSSKNILNITGHQGNANPNHKEHFHSLRWLE
jgi:hypothetical protein